MCAFLIRLRTGHIERILTSSHEADGIGFGHMCRQSTGEVVTAFTFIRPKPNIFKGLKMCIRDSSRTAQKNKRAEAAP